MAAYQQAPAEAAQRAIADFFNSRVVPPIGSWTLDNIVRHCHQLPAVEAYLHRTEVGYHSRMWMIRTWIGQHIKHYIDAQDKE
jgi:hypothetical protein